MTQMRVVTNTAELHQAISDGLSGDEIEVGVSEDVQRALDAARAEAFREGRDLVRNEAAREAALAERTRIITLREITLCGFEQELQKAIDTGMEPSAYALHLLQLQATANAAGTATRH